MATRTKKTTGAEAENPTAEPKKRVSRAKSPAATHKAPAKRAAKGQAAVFDEVHHRAEIEREAYLLWLGRGCSDGDAHGDWIRAVELVRARVLAK